MVGVVVVGGAVTTGALAGVLGGATVAGALVVVTVSVALALGVVVDGALQPAPATAATASAA